MPYHEEERAIVATKVGYYIDVLWKVIAMHLRVFLLPPGGALHIIKVCFV